MQELFTKRRLEEDQIALEEDLGAPKPVYVTDAGWYYRVCGDQYARGGSTSGARVLVGSTTASFADTVYTATLYDDQVVASWASYTLPATVSVTKATTNFPAAGVSPV